MATAVIDGIATRYEVLGSGPPLLMYAPGGFNATIETWSTQGVYAKIKLLDHLPKKYTCIVFDRRECGQSGGRVERVTWAHFVAQGKGLLDHLGIERAHIMGGCMGCCPVVGVRRRASRGDAEHGAVLAGRRRQIPHQQPPALCRASRFRAAARPGGGGRRSSPRTASRSAPTRAAARGPRSSGTTAPSPRPTRSRTSSNTSSSSPAWCAACSTATPRPVPSPRICCASTSPRWSSRAATLRTPPRRRAIWRNACRGRSIGTCRWRSRRRRERRGASRSFSPKRHR